MARTKGGGQGGPRRSRRTQGLEATPATNLKVKKATRATNPKVKRATPATNLKVKKAIGKPAKSKPGKRKKTVVEDVFEDITPKNIHEDGVVEDEVPEKAISEQEEPSHEVSHNEADDEVNMDHQASETAVSEQEESQHEVTEKEADDDVNMEQQDSEKSVSEQEESHHEVTEIEADDDVIMEHQASEKSVSEQEENTQQATTQQEKDAADDVNMEQDHNTDEVVKKKKKRGPTKMRRLAGNLKEKVEVTFTDCGDHVGSGSVTLSSFLGPLVREHVPVTITNWKKVDPVTKDTLWEEIQARFNLHEEWQKVVILKQLGSLWRCGKSRLVREVREAKSAAERTALKPSNIPSMQIWNSWVKSKCSTSFTARSEKYRELRRNQIPQTTSRKGMLRLAEDMKKKSDDPSKITRSKVWIAGHTHSDGRPVKPQFAETVEKIQSLDSQMDSTTASGNIREDAVSKVLGKDKPGRVRGFGRGVTATKLAFAHYRDAKIAEMESEIKELKGMVRDLAEKKKSNGDPVASASSCCLREGVMVKIMDWCEPGEVVVGVGVLRSSEEKYTIDGVKIGRNAVAILVKDALVPESSLWRPTLDMSSLDESVGCEISWPADKVVVDENLSPNLSMQTDEDDTRMCKIIDWTNDDEEVVAEGIICSTNPKFLVNSIALGPNAVCVQVVKVFNSDAHLWRPTAEINVIGGVINQKIPWPILKIEIIPSADATPTKRADPKASSPGSTSSTQSAKKKCILLDCNNSGRKVAEGRVASTDPNERCHHEPLGANASKVWVEVAKIGDARVWRPNSEIGCIADALGAPVAWPNDKIMYI